MPTKERLNMIAEQTQKQEEVDERQAWIEKDLPLEELPERLADRAYTPRPSESFGGVLNGFTGNGFLSPTLITRQALAILETNQQRARRARELSMRGDLEQLESMERESSLGRYRPRRYSDRPEGSRRFFRQED